jgi:hypothetical protein
MNRYYVMCKDDEQWESFVTTHSVCANTISMSIEIRDRSFILRNRLDNSESVYIKVVPSDLSPFCIRWGFEKIWLCDKKEFEGEIVV